MEGIPVMLSFGNEGGLRSFKLQEGSSSDVLGDLVSRHGPEVWQRNEEVSVKISSCKTGGFDHFSLKNTVGLVLRVLKADVLWIVFEKKTARPVIETKNAFDVLKKPKRLKCFPKR